MNKKAINRTIKAWQPFYKKKLTEEDAREIIENVGGYFNVLHEWDKEEKKHR